jgi:hypothetical protein
MIKSNVTFPKKNTCIGVGDLIRSTIEGDEYIVLVTEVNDAAMGVFSGVVVWSNWSLTHVASCVRKIDVSNFEKVPQDTMVALVQG